MVEYTHCLLLKIMERLSTSKHSPSTMYSVRRQNINLYPEDFPISSEYLQEAIKPLQKTYLYLLVRNIHLKLQPACGHGFGYQDYTKVHCIYKSQFAC